MGSIPGGGARVYRMRVIVGRTSARYSANLGRRDYAIDIPPNLNDDFLFLIKLPCYERGRKDETRARDREH